MAIPIIIDCSNLADEFSLSKGQVDDLIELTIKGVVGNFARNWDNQAKLSLNSTREMYRNALVTGFEGKRTGFVMLVGTLPNMIETGVGAFDMKIGFQNSMKVKQKKNGGWYLTIPFRSASSGALGESSVFASKLPEDIERIINGLKPKKSGEQALTKKDIPETYQPNTRQAITNYESKITFPEYTNKSSIYEGVVKNKQTYENATQGQFIGFRRVSDKSNPNAFIHTGIKAYNLSQKAFQSTDINGIVDRTVDAYLVSLGF